MSALISAFAYFKLAIHAIGSHAVVVVGIVVVERATGVDIAYIVGIAGVR